MSNETELELIFPERHSILLQIANALDFLHSSKIVHRNLSCRNIIVSIKIQVISNSHSVWSRSRWKGKSNCLTLGALKQFKTLILKPSLYLPFMLHQKFLSFSKMQKSCSSKLWLKIVNTGYPKFPGLHMMFFLLGSLSCTKKIQTNFDLLTLNYLTANWLLAKPLKTDSKKALIPMNL